MLIEQIASAITNRISAALEGEDIFEFPLEQVEDEIWLERNSLLLEQSRQGMAKAAPYSQEYSTDEIARRKVTEMGFCCGIFVNALEFPLPVPSSTFLDDAILFVGVDSELVASKVYLDEGFKYHHLRRATGHKPFVWVNMSSRYRLEDREYVKALLFYHTKLDARKVSARGVWEHAGQVWAIEPDSEPFPAPEEIIHLIVMRISDKYIQQYQRGHGTYYPRERQHMMPPPSEQQQ